jgi:two-component system sensor histidine kinase DevS
MGLWVPNRIVLGAVLIAIASAAIVVLTALREPWLDLPLKSDASAIQIGKADPAGPAKAAAGQLISITRADGGEPVVLEPSDLIEEPDLLSSYAEIRRLFARQSALAAALRQGPVVLTLRGSDGVTSTVTVTPARRPLRDLPAAFWVQLVTGIGSFLISCWVLALRPADRATRLFTASGIMLMLSALSAAIYSSRELAIDGQLFRLLSALNHVGTLGFGMAMIALFLSYPTQLVAPRRLLIIPAVLGAWLVLDVAHLAPTPAIGLQLPAALAMLAIVLCVGLQWRATRHDPRARAALRWLGLSVIVGAGGFILLIIAPILVASAPAVEQGYAFGFFLVIYAGIALGIGRYRLFDLDDWAFRITFYTAGALLLLALDAVLILVLNVQRELSFGIALLAIAFVYLPLRERLWTKIVARRRVESHELFRHVIDLTLAGSSTERSQQWKALLQTLFEPLAIEPAAQPVTQVESRAEGLEMLLPATADTPPLVLRYPWRGQRLFGSVHLQLAADLMQLMQYAETSRNAYERGGREERRRIARDLHDDVGARLLSGLHKTDVAETHRVLRDALAEIRTVVSGLSDGRAPLAQVVAALRHETGERLDAAGLAMEWPLAAVDDDARLVEYAVYRTLVSAHREAISNVIRHAAAGTVIVSLERSGAQLVMSVADDGVGVAAKPAGRPGGHGIGGMQRRLAEAGGTFAFVPVARGTCLRIAIPIKDEAGAVQGRALESSP